MDFKKDYGQALLIFVFGLLSLVVVDYLIRQFAGSPNNLGMPEMVWFALQVIISLVSLLFLSKIFKRFPSVRRYSAACCYYSSGRLCISALFMAMCFLRR
ncbi:MAG: hypothetical protein ACI9OH_001504 [Oleispira sp.]|jgi:hypothetical protein